MTIGLSLFIKVGRPFLSLLLNVMQLMELSTFTSGNRHLEYSLIYIHRNFQGELRNSSSTIMSFLL